MRREQIQIQQSTIVTDAPEETFTPHLGAGDGGSLLDNGLLQEDRLWTR